MALIPWRAKRHDEGERQLLPVGGFRSEMDRLFDSFMRDAFSWTEQPWRAGGAFDPAVDVEETDKEIAVRAEIPGMKADDLQLSISGNSLIISGEKKESGERREGGFLYQERRFGQFRREVPLPSAVHENDVKAEYKDGVLHVQLKKSQEALPKRISVSTG